MTCWHIASLGSSRFRIAISLSTLFDMCAGPLEAIEMNFRLLRKTVIYGKMVANERISRGRLTSGREGFQQDSLRRDVFLPICVRRGCRHEFSCAL